LVMLLGRALSVHRERGEPRSLDSREHRNACLIYGLRPRLGSVRQTLRHPRTTQPYACLWKQSKSGICIISTSFSNFSPTAYICTKWPSVPIYCVPPGCHLNRATKLFCGIYTRSAPEPFPLRVRAAAEAT
jgi:hypothetical protein